MKQIKCSNSELLILVDDEDYERLSQFNWTLHITNGGLRICRNKKVKNKQKTSSIANEIMQNDDCMYDHIDRNPLNNQKNNLRSCTWAQNSANTSKRKGSCTSKYKGVYLNKKNNKWKAAICIDYVSYHLGTFDTEEAAAKAYDIAAIKAFKEFANLNFK